LRETFKKSFHFFLTSTPFYNATFIAILFSITIFIVTLTTDFIVIYSTVLGFILGAILIENNIFGFTAV